MDLISQRVARGLPVKAKRRRHGHKSSGGGSAGGSLLSAEGGTSSSVDWNKWGERVTETKERVSEIKQIFQGGQVRALDRVQIRDQPAHTSSGLQWKQTENWKALNPLAPKVAAPQRGSEPRVETQSTPVEAEAQNVANVICGSTAFLAQLKKNPGLVTLTETAMFFTPLVSSRATLAIQLADITGVKKTTVTKGLEIRYVEVRPDGTNEEKEVTLMFVGGRSELFARLVSWAGGGKWAKV